MSVLLVLGIVAAVWFAFKALKGKAEVQNKEDWKSEFNAVNAAMTRDHEQIKSILSEAGFPMPDEPDSALVRQISSAILDNGSLTVEMRLACASVLAQALLSRDRPQMVATLVGELRQRFASSLQSSVVARYWLSQSTATLALALASQRDMAKRALDEAEAAIRLCSWAEDGYLAKLEAYKRIIPSLTEGTNERSSYEMRLMETIAYVFDNSDVLVIKDLDRWREEAAAMAA